jgi:hypothetical protein
MLGHQSPLALGLYAIEELCASNKRAQKVIAYEYKQIKRNEAVMDRIRTELEESVVNSKIYDGLRKKYLESSKDLTGTTGGQTTSANAGTTGSQTTSANAGTTASVGRDPYDATELEK